MRCGVHVSANNSEVKGLQGTRLLQIPPFERTQVGLFPDPNPCLPRAPPGAVATLSWNILKKEFRKIFPQEQHEPYLLARSSQARNSS